MRFDCASRRPISVARPAATASSRIDPADAYNVDLLLKPDREKALAFVRSASIVNQMSYRGIGQPGKQRLCHGKGLGYRRPDG
jgi:hypothetical protein